MLDIVYENPDYYVINKAAGQLSQSGKGFDVDIVSEVMTLRRSKGEPTYAAIINRLDRPVSGLVLVSKNKASAARLSKVMREKGFNKLYYALVCGKLSESEGTFVDYLVKDNQSVARVVDKDAPEGKRAELRYQVVAEIHDGERCFSVLRILLITGRFHQIRVQLASRGHGICGDTKYNPTPKEVPQAVRRYIGRSQIALCAYSLELEGKCFNIEPEWLSCLHQDDKVVI